MIQRLRAAREQDSGFTLIELLVTIVILGILAAVVSFGLATFQVSAKQKACESDLATVQQANMAYASTPNAVPASATNASLLSGGFLSAPVSTTNGYVITVAAGVVTVAPLLCAVT